MRTIPAILFRAALDTLHEGWSEDAADDLRRLAVEQFDLPPGRDADIPAGSVEAGEPQAEAPAVAEPLHPSSVVAVVDLTSASLGELRAIQELAEHVGSVAGAYTWGPRCSQGLETFDGPHFTEAGKLMSWIGDALTAVESAVHKETRRRVPDNALDIGTRLAALAVQTIDNGDPDEIEALARELLKMARVDRASEILAVALRGHAEAKGEGR